MPLMLTPKRTSAMLDSLAAPIDQRRQPEFVAAVEAQTSERRSDWTGKHPSGGAQRDLGFLDRAA